MALTKNSFLKVLPVTIESGDVTAGSKTLTYTNPGSTPGAARVEDASSVMIYYNGQAIPNSASDGAAVSKYYYTITTTLSPSTVDLNLGTVPSDVSTTVISIKVNPNYVSPGYVPIAVTTGLSKGEKFRIAVPGSTSFTAAGSANNNVGTVFTAATGTGWTLGDGVTTSPGLIFGVGSGTVTPVSPNFLVSDSFIVTYFYVLYTVK